MLFFFAAAIATTTLASKDTHVQECSILFDASSCGHLPRYLLTLFVHEVEALVLFAIYLEPQFSGLFLQRERDGKKQRLQEQCRGAITMRQRQCGQQSLRENVETTATTNVKCDCDNGFITLHEVVLDSGGGLLCQTRFASGRLPIPITAFAVVVILDPSFLHNGKNKSIIIATLVILAIDHQSTMSIE